MALLLYQVITDSPSLLTAVTIIIVTINSLCSVVIMHLLHFKSSVSTKFLTFQAMIYTAFGFATGAIIFTTTAAQDWFATHMFCVCHVIITNVLIDLTLVRIFKKQFDKCSEVWKILSVIKKVRVALFGTWLMTSIYCFAVYQVENGVPEEATELGTVESVVFEGRRALITFLVLIIVIIPTFVLAFLLILLLEITSKSTNERLEERKVEKLNVPFSVWSTLIYNKRLLLKTWLYNWNHNCKLVLSNHSVS